LGKGLTGLVLAVGLTLSAVAVGGPPASAASRGGAGYELLCNRADYGCVAETGYHGQSRWGANYFKVGHNCTSYVSWRLSELGMAQPWRPMGDGGAWDDGAVRSGVPVDDSPAAGAVAVWEPRSRMAPGGSGHVAYVERVDGSTIEITDDSTGGGTRRMRIARGSAYWPSHFIHLRDLVDPVAVGERVLGGVRVAVAMSEGALHTIDGGRWIVGSMGLDYVT
jgi:surface antigen